MRRIVVALGGVMVLVMTFAGCSTTLGDLPLPGTGVEGETIVVTCDKVSEPAAVRYAWGAADEPNVRNGAGLPASSFRTDDWKMVSSDGR